MGSRRHLLPAIYNSNLERFHSFLHHEQATDAVKVEPIEGLIWLNDTETIDLLDSDNENDEHIAGN